LRDAVSVLTAGGQAVRFREQPQVRGQSGIESDFNSCAAARRLRPGILDQTVFDRTGGAGSGAAAAVDFLPMTDFQNDNDYLFPLDLVYHAIVSDTDAIDILIAAHLPAAGGARLDRKQGDGSQNSNLILASYFPQLPLSGG
jgi:hypothetical protein